MTDRREDEGATANPTRKRKRSETDAEELAVDNGNSLFRAISEDRMDLVKSLLEDKSRGVNVNEVIGDESATALNLATTTQRFNIARLLLKYGANANHQMTNGLTPLVTAIFFDSRETVKALLQHGADADYKGHLGWTPLSVAIQQENWEMVQILLKHGVEVNRPLTDETANTPLIHAIHFCPLSIIRSLLEHGADPMQSSTHSGLPPLLVALLQRRFDVANVLMEHGADVNQETPDEQVPILSAVSHRGITKGVELLLQAGADPNRARSRAVSPLVWAIAGGNPRVTQLLLQYKARVDPVLFKFFTDYSGNGSFVKWIRQDPQRTFLSLKTLARETNEETIQVRNNFNVAVTLLWAYHYQDPNHNGGPPLLKDSPKELSDEEFKMRYKWMVHATASLIHRDHDILQQLLCVYTADVAMEKCLFTEKTPLEIALSLFSGDCYYEYALHGLEMIMKWGPRALRIPDIVADGRRPIEVAIDRGLPMATIEKMVQLWPASAFIRDPVTRLYVFLMVASHRQSYSASDVYCVSRGVLPDMIATLVKDHPRVS